MESFRKVRVIVSGRVQGVGYRHWCSNLANELELSGWVRNLASGEVEAVFSGREEFVNLMIDSCKTGPVFAHVTSVEVTDITEPVAGKFEILRSGEKQTPYS